MSSALTEFDARLFRLKEELGVTEDQQVAHALGMTKAAFSYRKKAGNFPLEYVAKLVATSPHVDVHYVETGERTTDLWLRRAGGVAKAARFAREMRATEPGRHYTPDASTAAEALHARALRLNNLETLLRRLDDEEFDLVLRLVGKLVR